MNTLQHEAKIGAFFREFPFLSRYVNPEDVQFIVVRRWDDDLYNLQTIEYEGEAREMPLAQNKAHLLDGERDHVATFSGWRTVTWWKPSTWSPRLETFHVAMSRLGEEQLSRTTLIVSLSWATTGSGKVTLTIWKMPREYQNAAQWLARHYPTLEDRERKKIKKFKI